LRETKKHHTANHASSCVRWILSGFWKRSFVAEQLHEFRFLKWVGTANAIGWRVGSFALYKKWQAHSGVEKETFLHYFQGAATAYCIQIGRTWQFDSATELKALRRRKGGFHPPQSYRYVGREELVRLMV
jgi:hypothetical protein